MLALLQTVGKAPRKHRGAVALLDSEFAKPGKLPTGTSEAFHRLFDARLEDDYRRLDPVSLDEAAELLAVAEGFVQAIRDYLTVIGCPLGV